MKFESVDATRARDVRALAERCAADLTARFGPGHWSRVSTLETYRRHCAAGRFWAGFEHDRLVASFALWPKKPNFISRRRFSRPDQPGLWLTNLAVDPARQRHGLGRACFDEMRRIARKQNIGWIRFDAYSAAAGAATFYEKCGCTKVDETTLRGVGLFIFEIPV